MCLTVGEVEKWLTNQFCEGDPGNGKSENTRVCIGLDGGQGWTCTTGLLMEGALTVLSVSREFIEATKGFEVVCNREFSCLW
jgi:hypothetical protein